MAITSGTLRSANFYGPADSARPATSHLLRRRCSTATYCVNPGGHLDPTAPDESEISPRNPRRSTVSAARDTLDSWLTRSWSSRRRASRSMSLSVDERLELIGAVWDSIDHQARPVSPGVAALVEARVARTLGRTRLTVRIGTSPGANYASDKGLDLPSAPASGRSPRHRGSCRLVHRRGSGAGVSSLRGTRRGHRAHSRRADCAAGPSRRRRVHLRVFPYEFWYLVHEDLEIVEVVALVHDRQDPAATRRRIS